jgi:OPA family glycerol-3-phosphate transporter-like MFS transporter
LIDEGASSPGVTSPDSAPALDAGAPSVVTAGARATRAGWTVIGSLAVGYVGIYLCRKNLAVAVPLLQQAFHANREDIGRIASVGTGAYAIGKFLGGPVVDRLGGRRGFLLSMVLVAAFGAAGAFSPGLLGLTIFYAMNRLTGAAGWGAAVKLVPTWFGVKRTATVIGALSVSYVAGGVLATLLAREIVTLGGGWRAVMGLPSLVLLVLLVVCALLVRMGPVRGSSHEEHFSGSALMRLLRKPRFGVACGLSFAVTLMRETFNTWTVDFLTSIQPGTKSVATAALHSIGFDLAGAGAILVAGLMYDRISADRRRWLLASTLAVLAVVLAVLPGAARANPSSAVVLVGVVGLLVYGPYSLLSGVLAVECGGTELAATAANAIDGVGYVGAILSGATLGTLLDRGGYSLGFGVLAGVTGLAAVLALGLRGEP